MSRPPAAAQGPGSGSGSGPGPGPGRAEIVAILASFGDRPPDEVPEGIDSMELAWLVHQIEQRYGAGVDDATMARMTTVSAVLEELATLLPHPGPPEPPLAAGEAAASGADAGTPASGAEAAGLALGAGGSGAGAARAGTPGLRAEAAGSVLDVGGPGADAAGLALRGGAPGPGAGAGDARAGGLGSRADGAGDGG